jgi:hypothetical protein
MPRGAAKGERRGGRSKGTPNKRTKEFQQRVERYGDPVEWQMKIMNGIDPDTDKPAKPPYDIAMRLDAAKGAANYVRPKLSSVEHKGTIGFNAGALSDEDLESLIRIVAKASGSSAT